MVVKMHLEPKVEPLFHPDSYGYRPFKSAHDAVGQARKRCWKYDWVLDLDIKGFFDNIPHELLMRAVRKHAPEKWVVLYVERWLKAPGPKRARTTDDARKGNAARRSSLSVAGEPFPALRLRCVDGAQVPKHPL